MKVNLDKLYFGKVQEIHKYFLIIALPHGQKGKCEIGNISETFSKQLSLINEENDQNVPELEHIFCIGQDVQVKILSTGKMPKLTLEPTVINSSISIRQIKQNMYFQMAIESVEDNGYILENGIKNLKAFLSFNESERDLKVGQLVKVKPREVSKDIVKGKLRVVNFVYKVNKTNEIINEEDFASILPGAFIATKLQINKAGNAVGKYGAFNVVVNFDHFKKDSINLENQTLVVISKDMVEKIIECSALPHLLLKKDSLKSKMIGKTDHNGKIKKILPNDDLLLSSSVEKDSEIIITKEHIEKGITKELETNVTIRIVDYNLVDGVYYGSTLDSLLSHSYVNVSQARIGEVIEGTIIKYTAKGYVVKISTSIKGFIPNIFVSDVKGIILSSIFEVGSNVKCMVVGVNLEDESLILTSRKTFLTSNLKKPKTIEYVKVGYIVDAIVSKVLEHGVLFQLIGGLMGWLPAATLPDSIRNDLKGNFPIWKYMKMTIKSVDIDNNRIKLSQITDSNNSDDDGYDDLNDKAEFLSPIGSIFNCVITKSSSDGFYVQLLPIKKSAFLPYIHLTDYTETQPYLQTIYSDSLKSNKKNRQQFKVVIINNSTGKLIVSKKQSLIKCCTEKPELFCNLNNKSIELNNRYIGWIISNSEKCGLFVELPGNITGLVTMKNITMSHNVDEDFKENNLLVGQTVFISVLDKDKKRNNKYFFSMKLNDTYKPLEDISLWSIDYLKELLDEKQYVRSINRSEYIRNLNIGQLIDVTIGTKYEWGWTININNDVSGIVMNENLPKSSINSGANFKGVIIDLVLDVDCVEVCLRENIVHAVQNNQELSRNIEINDLLKCEIINITTNYVFANLQGHANGHFVYIPLRKFLTDFNKTKWLLNQKHNVIIKRKLNNGHYIGNLKSNEPIIHNDDGSLIKTKSAITTKSLNKLLQKKIVINHNGQYPTFFYSKSKTRLFFYLSKKQKGFCNFVEYTNSLNILNKLLETHYKLKQNLNRLATVQSKECDNKNGCYPCHMLINDELKVGDPVIGHVVKILYNYRVVLKLPFGIKSTVDIKKSKNPSIYVMPAKDSFVQCRIDAINGDEYIVAITQIQKQKVDEKQINMEVIEKEDEKVVVDTNEDDENDEKSYESSDDEDSVELPEIITVSKNKYANDKSVKVSLKRKHSEDSDNENTDDDNSVNDEINLKAPKKVKRHHTVEDELKIRESEKRRETGEHLKNPQTEEEFEFFVFSNSKDSYSWIKYIKFLIDNDNHGDALMKIRNLRERAWTKLDSTDVEGRFKILKEVVNVEIAYLKSLEKNEIEFDDKLRDFKIFLNLALTTKPKNMYIHICTILQQMKLYDVAEMIAKMFIKDHKMDYMAWYHLFSVRFEQKKFVVIREMLTNAERILKKNDFRQLMWKVGETEMKMGNRNKGLNIFKNLMMDKMKDGSMKTRIVDLLKKLELTEYIDEIENMKENIMVSE